MPTDVAPIDSARPVSNADASGARASNARASNVCGPNRPDQGAGAQSAGHAPQENARQENARQENARQENRAQENGRRRNAPRRNEWTQGTPAAAISYAPHRKIHPKAVQGRFRNIKTALGWGLTALFIALPWLRWDRGGGAPDQAVLFDLGAQRFYIFAVELWPQHVYYMTGVMILAALGLFFATALGGRVWCGFTCPQTVWTDFFVWIERRVEGDPGARIRLDRRPWAPDWIVGKTIKHAGWLAASFVTGFSGVAWLTDAPTLAADLLRFDAPALAVGSVLFVAAATYLMAGFMREQMCFYVCPWPRFQASMLDDESLVVAYQDRRGEGRAPLRKSEDWAARSARGLGDCIDCGQCVQVCPTGIDIRDGYQMECISCGLCVDACNDVMARLNRPGDLIRFEAPAAAPAEDGRAEDGRTTDGRATETRETEAGKTNKPRRPRLLRPRVVVYGLSMIVVVGFMATALALKADADVAVLRDRGPLFVVLSDGRVQNAYTVKISNMTLADERYRLTVSGPAGALLRAAGEDVEQTALTLTARADSVATYRILVRARIESPAEKGTGSGGTGSGPSSVPLIVTATPERAGSTPAVRETTFSAP